jgi:hypothetical protein
MPRTHTTVKPSVDRCRNCGKPGASIYQAANGAERVKPVCQTCHEQEISRYLREWTANHRPYKVGPGRDPDHDHRDFKAVDWWERQMADWNSI